MKKSNPIKSVISKGLFFAVILSAVLGGIVSEFFHQREEQRRFSEVSSTAVQAYGNAIRKDLEVGDLMSVRRTLEPVIELKQFSAFRIVNSNGEQLLLIPYFPDDWFKPTASKFSADIKDNNGNVSWQLEGFAEENKYTFKTIDFFVFIFTVVSISTLVLLIYTRRTSSILVKDIQAVESDLASLGTGSFSPTKQESTTVEVSFIRDNISKLAVELDEKKKMEVQLEKNKAEVQLARQVAHDIRSPLSAIRMVTDHLNDKTDVQKLIKDAASRLSSIADDLLNRTKVKSERFEVQTASAKIYSLIEEKKVTHRTIEWKIENSCDNCTVGGDLNRVLQIVSNILDNAAESITKSGKVTLKLSEDVGHFNIEAIDNGKGIPEEIRPKLFSKGYSYEKKNGNGLGLFSAREYLESIGGNINFVSAINSGSNFTIQLPKV